MPIYELGDSNIIISHILVGYCTTSNGTRLKLGLIMGTLSIVKV